VENEKGDAVMKPTEQLKEEHEAIKIVLGILSNVSKKLAARETVNQEDLGRILEFIETFADTCHHGKEEDLLFVAMENVGIPRDRGPIAVMLREHEFQKKNSTS
jgi:hemerythrin-like domain-containing protein